MANYIISYDLNGRTPTHAQMDAHLNSGGYTRARILETVWYVKAPHDLNTVFSYINRILSDNDRLLVVQAMNAQVRNLLVDLDSLRKAWNE